MWHIIIALIFNALDCITGVISGYKRDGRLISTKLRDGLFKKCGFILCYGLGFLLNFAQHQIGLDININILPAICLYVIFTELVSIIENISSLNDKILPDKIKKLIGGLADDERD